MNDNDGGGGGGGGRATATTTTAEVTMTTAATVLHAGMLCSAVSVATKYADSRPL